MILDHPGAHLDHQLLMTMTLDQVTALVHPVLEHPGVTMTLDQALAAPAPVAPVQALTMMESLLTIK